MKSESMKAENSESGGESESSENINQRHRKWRNVIAKWRRKDGAKYKRNASGCG